MRELENKIREALPRLQKIEKGQRFFSKYYGVIVATQVKELSRDKYDIYGFDETEGLPRSNYYPRELELIGHPIKLNDVLEYLLDVEKYSTKDSQMQKVLNVWDLSSVFLADQSDELKEFLNNL